jgi:predicted aspartyl protease
MKIRLTNSSVLLLVLALLCFQFEAKGKAYQVPIELSDYNLIFTKVSVNGKEVLALIDTGSSSPVLLSSTLAGELKLPLTDDKNSTTRGLDGKTYPIQRGQVETLNIGDYQKRGVLIQVAGDRIETVARQVKTPFDIILGWEFLAEKYFLLDYKRRVLQFSDDPLQMGEDGLSASYSVVNKVPVIKGTLDKEEVMLLFDTGAPMCNIDAGYAHEKSGQVIPKEVTIGGKKLALQWRVKDLSVTKKSLGNVGTIGNNLLSLHAVYFDTNKKMIHLY